MSLITKCPACTTMFKVVPDQLRVSDGWVRCGQCNEVFDANANLESAAPTVPSEANRRTRDPGSAIFFSLTDNGIPEKVPNLGHAETDSADDRGSANDPVPALEVNLRTLHGEPAKTAVQANEPSLHWETTSVAAAVATGATKGEDAELALASGPRHSFMHDTNSPSKVSTSRVLRVTLALLNVFLTAGLTLQVVTFERDRIAATLPQTTPALQTLCAALSCTLSPLRQIESVIIDSSAFTRIRGDVYRLSFTLKNTARTSLATPGMELTLTDTEDRAVARRVFLPDVFAGSSPVVEAGAELHASLPVNVKLAGNHEKISGYRLLSFYP